MQHHQDCFESVSIDDSRWPYDLIGSKILMGVWHKKGERKSEYDDSSTGLYKFKPVKGYVTIRWYGT
jgi:hypothetical protein